MSSSTPTIRSVKARAVDVPISRPVKNAFGVIRCVLAHRQPMSASNDREHPAPSPHFPRRPFPG